MRQARTRSGEREGLVMEGPYEAMLRAAGLVPIAGADEAGRGACAGPLVAAAVILDPGKPVSGLADSKKLTVRQREALYTEILQNAQVALTSVSAKECDDGLQKANLRALREAVLSLGVAPGFVIVDGFFVDGLGVPTIGMWKGDQMAACVSAASIIAKVARDRIMDELDDEYPGYGFRIHKGYATALHQSRLDEWGPCPQHRMSYANVARTVRVVPL